MNTSRLVSIVLAAALGGIVQAQAATLTRAEVKQETLAAIKAGDIAAPGDLGLTERQLFPSRYPTVPMAAGLTRADVKAEFVAASKAGDIPEPGDLDETPRDLDPARYPAEAAVPQLNRATVKAQLADAIRTGNVSVGDLAVPLNQLEPGRYPLKARAGAA